MSEGQGPEPQRRWFDPASVDLVNSLSLTVRGDEADQFLYHYTSAEVLLENILPKRQLLLGLYQEMRDPHENREPSIGLEYTEEPRADHMSLADVRDLVRDLRNQMRILSMTMDAADYPMPETQVFARGYTRPRMWEQYGDRHRGACLAFSAKCLTGSFYAALRNGGAPTCGSVRYTEAGMAASPARTIQADELTEDRGATVVTAHLMQHHWDFWFLKQEDWRQEYEFRFVKFDLAIDPRKPLFVPFGDCLRAVVLGEEFDRERSEEVKQLATPLGVRVLRLDWSSGWPNLEPV